MAIAVPGPLRMPMFRAWWIGTQTSNAGSWMQQVAAAWLMYASTRSAAMVGLLGLAQRGPSMLLTPFGGRLADRGDRRRVLVATLALQLVAAVGFTVASFSGRIDPTVLLVLAVAGGVGQALIWPSQAATVSSLVPRQDVAAAVSLNSAGFNLARVVGPACAGLMIDAGLATLCFALNAISFVAPLVIARFRLPESSAGTRDQGAHLRDGVRHVLESPPLRRLVGGCVVFTLCAAPLNVLMPPYARAVGGGAAALGVLLAAFGAGATVGAGLVVPLARRFGRARLIPAAMAAFAVMGVGCAVAPDVPVAAVLCALAGFCWLAVFSSTNAAVQLATGDALRGRVLALYFWALIGPMAISGLIVGAAASAIGMRLALGLCSIPLALYAAYALWRPVREIDEVTV